MSAQTHSRWSGIVWVGALSLMALLGAGMAARPGIRSASVGLQDQEIPAVAPLGCG
jgi:hypothetical protein